MHVKCCECSAEAFVEENKITPWRWVSLSLDEVTEAEVWHCPECAKHELSEDALAVYESAEKLQPHLEEYLRTFNLEWSDIPALLFDIRIPRQNLGRWAQDHLVRYKRHLQDEARVAKGLPELPRPQFGKITSLRGINYK